MTAPEVAGSTRLSLGCEARRAESNHHSRSTSRNTVGDRDGCPEGSGSAAQLVAETRSRRGCPGDIEREFRLDATPARGFVAQAEEALAEDHPGRAILNFERARLLSPKSDVIARGLARARRAANLPSDEPRLAGRSSQILRTDEWGEVALAGLSLAAGALIALVWKLVGRRAFAIIALLGGLVAVVGFWANVRAEPPPTLAVVVSPNCVARLGPSEGAAASFTPPEGSLVLIERTHEHFALISSDGRQGWMPSSGVETILPKNSNRLRAGIRRGGGRRGALRRWYAPSSLMGMEQTD